MDDLGVPLFSETSICTMGVFCWMIWCDLMWFALYNKNTTHLFWVGVIYRYIMNTICREILSLIEMTSSSVSSIVWKIRRPVKSGFTTLSRCECKVPSMSNQLLLMNTNPVSSWSKKTLSFTSVTVDGSKIPNNHLAWGCIPSPSFYQRDFNYQPQLVSWSRISGCHQQLKGWIHGPCKLSLWETRSKTSLNPVSPCWTSHGQMMFNRKNTGEKNKIWFVILEFLNNRKPYLRSFTFGFIVGTYF